MKINESSLYLGDNGMCLCGAHLGSTARRTGRDISGQPIMRVRPNDLADGGVDSVTCETPSCRVTVKASRIVLSMIESRC